MTAEPTAPMPLSTMTRRSLVVGGAMALTAGAAFAAQPRRVEHQLKREKLGDLVARQIGPWTITTPGGVVVAQEETEHTDGYDQLLTRVYVADGLPAVMLLIAYGSTQGGSLQLHRPETCYPAQGFRLGAFDDDNLRLDDGETVAARRFTARRDDRNERLFYWTRIARRFPRNTAEEYGAIFSSVLRGVVPDGVLVRVSTISLDIAQADSALTRFAREMIATARPMGREILVGRS